MVRATIKGAEPKKHMYGIENQILNFNPSKKDRVQALDRKFVVTTQNRFHKGLMFQVDPKLTLSSKRWSLFLENALGYTNEQAAIRKASSLQFNHPKVYQVLVSSNYQINLKPIS